MKTRIFFCAFVLGLVGCAAPGGPPNYQAQQNFLNALSVGSHIEQNRNYQRQYAPPPPQSVNTICRRNPVDGSVFCTSN